MKITVELPEDLLVRVKSVAAKRHTTMKALIEHALRTEVGFEASTASAESHLLQKGPYGILSLKSRAVKITSEMIYRMMEDEDV